MMGYSNRLALLGAMLVALGACAPGDSDTMTDTTAGASDASAMTTEGAMLDPDAATREQLMALPGMDAEAADALVAGRPYTTMVAVDSVLMAHLSEAERDTLYGRLWKPLDLNTASGTEIMLIPGVGERMRHEFEEYRPYTDIQQFRREIGKYVDDAEVARLSRYVTIR